MNFQTKITPYLLEGYLILSLSAEWIKLFNQIPSFSIFIDDSQKLHIVSQEVIQIEKGTKETGKI